MDNLSRESRLLMQPFTSADMIAELIARGALGVLENRTHLAGIVARQSDMTHDQVKDLLSARCVKELMDGILQENAITVSIGHPGGDFPPGDQQAVAQIIIPIPAYNDNGKYGIVSAIIDGTCVEIEEDPMVVDGVRHAWVDDVDEIDDGPFPYERND